MQVICLEDDAFYALVEQVVQRIKETHGIKDDRWISAEEAMQKLRITSKTTLQKLRDEGKNRYSQTDSGIFTSICCLIFSLFVLMEQAIFFLKFPVMLHPSLYDTHYSQSQH
jgi:hypothetical protein